MNDLARLLLLLVLAALFLSIVRGDTRRWLRAKFLGKVAAARAAR